MTLTCFQTNLAVYPDALDFVTTASLRACVVPMGSEGSALTSALAAVEALLLLLLAWQLKLLLAWLAVSVGGNVTCNVSHIFSTCTLCKNLWVVRALVSLQISKHACSAAGSAVEVAAWSAACSLGCWFDCWLFYWFC